MNMRTKCNGSLLIFSVLVLMPVAMAAGNIDGLSAEGNAKILWNRTYPNLSTSYELGDLDGDGLKDIVEMTRDKFVAFKGSDGTVLWSYNYAMPPYSYFDLYDLNNDGKK